MNGGSCMTSRVPKFYQLSPDERLKILAEKVGLNDKDVQKIRGESGFTIADAEVMIENVIGHFPVPLGVAANFKVNGKDIFIPMATEEPSVIAAASNAARLTYHTGGFTTSYTGSIMRGQIHITNVKAPYSALARIYEHREEIIHICNNQDQTLINLGGGVKDLNVQVIETNGEKQLVIHLFVDVKDAMGANTINTMAEQVAPLIEKITGGDAVLRIISNLTDQRITRVRAVFENPFEGDVAATKKFLQAYQLSLHDPYRAATHNKGIMNGITAVVLATGNDTRAVEAGMHAYASITGHYQTLSHWELGEDHSLIGTLEAPLAVGLIGGATQTHPIAKLVMKILQVNTSEELSGVIAAVGLAQNFAAMKALVSDGIQKGHMKLHAKNLAKMAGAKQDQLDEVVKRAVAENKLQFDEMKKMIEDINK